jgi:hypothetical protein
VFELDGESLEFRLSGAFVEAEVALESDCDEGHNEHQPDADELKKGNLAGVWQESAEHQKGLFLGYWSACSEQTPDKTKRERGLRVRLPSLVVV